MIRAFLALALVPFLLAACGPTESQKAQEKVDSGNSKITRLNQINLSVANTYGIILSAKDSISSSTVQEINTKSLERLSVSQLQAVQAASAEYVALADQVIEILNSGSVRYHGDRGSIQRGRATAADMHQSITARLNNK